jgi:hypothetical protein
VRKALAVVLVTLVVLVVGGDFLLGSIAEARLAEAAQQRLGLTERPTVDLEGFPFSYYALRRRFPGASLEGRDVRVEGLTVERFSLELRDVRFDSTAAIAGGGGTLRASEGRGTVEVTEQALGAYLERQDVPFRVELVGPGVRASGRISLGGTDVDASVVGKLAVTEGALELRPTGFATGRFVDIPLPAVAFRIDLPQILPGLAYEDVTVQRGRAVLSFRLRRAVVPL